MKPSSVKQGLASDNNSDFRFLFRAAMTISAYAITVYVKLNSSSICMVDISFQLSLT